MFPDPKTLTDEEIEARLLAYAEKVRALASAKIPLPLPSGEGDKA